MLKKTTSCLYVPAVIPYSYTHHSNPRYERVYNDFEHRANQWFEFLNELDDAYDIGKCMFDKRDADKDLGLVGDLYYLGKLHEFFLVAGAENDQQDRCLESAAL